MKRELGSIPADFEPWFVMWDSVLFLPGANTENIPLYGHTDEIGSIPCYRHRTCGALVKLDDKFPKRVCPHCGVDTKLEYANLSQEGKVDAFGAAYIPSA